MKCRFLEANKGSLQFDCLSILLGVVSTPTITSLDCPSQQGAIRLEGNPPVVCLPARLIQSNNCSFRPRRPSIRPQKCQRSGDRCHRWTWLVSLRLKNYIHSYLVNKDVKNKKNSISILFSAPKLLLCLPPKRFHVDHIGAHLFDEVQILGGR
ncbi:hypothetical protein CRE_15062 [Caenorhabditis remanei]|uniref:Uncharacterized protein n=1 Tax=Caenorhabditis remanei TaxID=31234 RepID=E3NML3_CAERE|nr:hypothetical protein CRE_15062 [Caenorhabditis remanei]